MDFPGVVRNPLPLVRFRQKDRFSTPLVEKPPAPAAVHRTFIVFLFFSFSSSRRRPSRLLSKSRKPTPRPLSRFHFLLLTSLSLFAIELRSKVGVQPRAALPTPSFNTHHTHPTPQRTTEPPPRRRPPRPGDTGHRRRPLSRVEIPHGL